MLIKLDEKETYIIENKFEYACVQHSDFPWYFNDKIKEWNGIGKWNEKDTRQKLIIYG